MPDPLKKTVSASQVPALFNLSPYMTRFELYHWFKSGAAFEQKEHSRMAWGNLVEPWIIGRAAEMLNLEAAHHKEQKYVAHPTLRIGCTRDSDVNDPTKGRGVIEAKAVDWLVFKNDWTDRAAPKHIELQVAAQMIAEDVQWGVIAVMVGNNDQIKLYRRERDQKMDAEIIAAIDQFFADLAADNEPDPYGTADEMQVLNHLYPAVVPAKVIEIMDDEALANDVRMFNWAREQQKIFAGEETRLKPIILGAAKDAEILRVAGAEVTIKKIETKASVVELPPEERKFLIRLAADHDEADRERLLKLAGWQIETRKAGVQNRISIRLVEGEEATGPAQEMTP